MKKLLQSVLLGTLLASFTLNSYAQVNNQLSNLTSPTKINQSLMPAPRTSINLGGKGKEWRTLYLSDSLIMDGKLTLRVKPGSNFFIGPRAGAGNGIIEGYHNTAAGWDALYWVSSGENNTAMGSEALLFNSSGSDNTATGYYALTDNTSGSENTASGSIALSSNTTGYENTASGYFALAHNSTGYWNTANGSYALAGNSTGFNNTATGESALNNNSTGSHNTANGGAALASNSTGINNTAIGVSALSGNTIGTRNTALGVSAGTLINTGVRNTFIGYHANCSSGELTNTTALGNEALVNASNTVRIWNNEITSIGGFVEWTSISDGRVKKNIKSNVPGLTFINKLVPVTYNLDLDATDKLIQRPVTKTTEGKPLPMENAEVMARKEQENILYTGFVAQEVEQAAKELNYSFSGVDAAKSDKDLYGLRYAQFVVPLVKAVQELSQKNDEKDAQIESLQKQINELKAMVLSNSAKNTSLNQSANNGFAKAGLDQNTPNPFSSTAFVSYTLPATYSTAKIVITDKSGKALKVISLAGNANGSITIDATDLSAGMYQYTLYIDQKLISSRQMIVSK